MNELRELVAKWRNRANTFELSGDLKDADAHRLVADELEETLDDLEEQNVSEDLALSPEEFAALVGEGMVGNEPKRTNARVHGLDSDGGDD